MALKHPGTAEAAAQEWCWRCWRAEKGNRGGQRGGREEKLGQGGAHWETRLETASPGPREGKTSRCPSLWGLQAGHSQSPTFAASVSWERSCAAHEHMKGFISAPGSHADCKIPGTGSSSVSILGSPSAPQHKNHREMGFLGEISLLLLGYL